MTQHAALAAIGVGIITERLRIKRDAGTRRLYGVFHGWLQSWKLGVEDLRSEEAREAPTPRFSRMCGK
jgi:hypothetical protein